MQLAPRNPATITLALPLAVAGFLAGCCALYVAGFMAITGTYEQLLIDYPSIVAPLERQGMSTNVQVFGIACWIGAAVMFGASFVGLLRKPWALRVVRWAFAVPYVLLAIYLLVVMRGTGIVHVTDTEIAGSPIDQMQLFYIRYNFVFPALIGVLAVAMVHVGAWRQRAVNAYTDADITVPAVGDRIIEDIRTHGQDERYRKSNYASVFLHVFILIILPWLLESLGCVEPYLVPKGSGNPVVEMLKIVQPKKIKKKKWILNPESAIILDVPDLDDSEIEKEVEVESQKIYTANTNVHGKIGQGEGKEGGWPDGMDKAVVRFIRLEYRGEGWDDGMNDGPVHLRADMNFLDEFHKVTGFKTRNYSESHPIRDLKKYPKGYAPPFVYMTGDGNISVSSGDMKILREYMLEGGMLFADAGSPQWDRAFRSFIKQVFPDKQLLTIADDDPLFQQPYQFPNGAPPLWHHGGNRALGMKHKGRWILFYHPGDINDAWKTGHSGMKRSLADAAYQTGINIIYYSFTHYLEETRKYRK